MLLVIASEFLSDIGNRTMEGHAREVERMVLEGATPRQVDSALENWGMAMGNLAGFGRAAAARGALA